MPNLSQNDRRILVDLLVFGDDRAGNIARRTGAHPDAISRRFRGLVEEGHIRDKGHGVYQLREKGRLAARSLIQSGYNPWVGVAEDAEESG